MQLGIEGAVKVHASLEFYLKSIVMGRERGSRYRRLNIAR